jgi:ACR3 family arsenite transporter
VAGITLGHFFNGAFQAIGQLEMAQVNLPVAVLVWLMIIPMLLKVDLHALKGVRAHWRGVGVTTFVNWAVKPFSMALLGWLFIGWLFRPWLPAVHRHGVRVEPPVEWRASFHPVAGGAQ